MQQAVEAREIDERAEIGDVLHAAGAVLADLDRGQQVALLVGHAILEQLAAREDQVAALVADLDQLEFQRLVDEGLDIMDRIDIELRTGQEGLDAVDIHDQAAAYAARDEAVERAAFGVLAQERVPAQLLVGPGLAQLDHAVVALHVDEQNVVLVADLDLGGVLELAGRDDALSLVADVHEHLVAANGQDGALHDLARLELILRAGQRSGHKIVVATRLGSEGHGLVFRHVLCVPTPAPGAVSVREPAEPRQWLPCVPRRGARGPPPS